MIIFKLKQYLIDCGKSELTLLFAKIEEIIECPLCESAYNYVVYWSPSSTHTMANIILKAGYKVVSVDLIAKLVLLKKTDN